MNGDEWDKYNCERKVRHATKTKAEKEVKRKKAIHGIGAKKLHAYKCDMCGAYHTGNK